MTWKTYLARLLDPQSFEIFDRRRDKISALNITITHLNNELESCQAKANGLNSRVTELEVLNNTKTKNTLKTDLSKFKTRAKYRTASRQSFYLHEFLNDSEQRDAVKKWVDVTIDSAKLQGSLDARAKQLRELIFDAMGGKDLHVPESLGKDYWRTPKETIDAKFKVDCEDIAVFIQYVYDIVFKDDNRLFLALGGACTEDGWNAFNHAYSIWLHDDGHFYVIESAVGSSGVYSTYIEKALRDFGKVPQDKNVRYGNLAWLANKHQTYKRVVLNNVSE